jgi:hypothetical protein
MREDLHSGFNTSSRASAEVRAVDSCSHVLKANFGMILGGLLASCKQSSSLGGGDSQDWSPDTGHYIYVA